MPSDAILKTMNFVHRAMLTLSFGKIGWETAGMPALELTTIGRKSGESRSVMLTSPVQEGDAIVIVASRGGDDKHPAWFLNLRANPEVQVSYRGAKTTTMHAHIAGPDERPALWEKVVASQKRYGDYQTKTDREIPLVLLTPTA